MGIARNDFFRGWWARHLYLLIMTTALLGTVGQVRTAPSVQKQPTEKDYDGPNQRKFFRPFFPLFRDYRADLDRNNRLWLTRFEKKQSRHFPMKTKLETGSRPGSFIQLAADTVFFTWSRPRPPEKGEGRELCLAWLEFETEDPDRHGHYESDLDDRECFPYAGRLIRQDVLLLEDEVYLAWINRWREKYYLNRWESDDDETRLLRVSPHRPLALYLRKRPEKIEDAELPEDFVDIHLIEENPLDRSESWRVRIRGLSETWFPLRGITPGLAGLFEFHNKVYGLVSDERGTLWLLDQNNARFQLYRPEDSTTRWRDWTLRLDQDNQGKPRLEFFFLRAGGGLWRSGGLVPADFRAGRLKLRGDRYQWCPPFQGLRALKGVQELLGNLGSNIWQTWRPDNGRPRFDRLRMRDHRRGSGYGLNIKWDFSQNLSGGIEYSYGLNQDWNYRHLGPFLATSRRELSLRVPEPGMYYFHFRAYQGDTPLDSLRLPVRVGKFRGKIRLSNPEYRLRTGQPPGGPIPVLYGRGPSLTLDILARPEVAGPLRYYVQPGERAYPAGGSLPRQSSLVPPGRKSLTLAPAAGVQTLYWEPLNENGRVIGPRQAIRVHWQKPAAAKPAEVARLEKLESELETLLRDLRAGAYRSRKARENLWQRIEEIQKSLRARGKG